MNPPIMTTHRVAAQARRVVDEMNAFATVVREEHDGAYLGDLAARSSCANFSQTQWFLAMVADRHILRLEDDD